MKKILLLISVAILIQYNCRSQNPTDMINTETVTELDLEKYMGTWYEIARFPNSFEKDMVGVTATYTLKSNGKIEVLNQGFKNTLDGKHKTAKGKAKLPDPGQPGKLKVSFFLFFYGDYYVLELDSRDYQWAMIGSSTPEYFWILSRTPQMDQEVYLNLLQNAKERGYDLSILQKVDQK